MYDVSIASLWNSELAFTLARRMATLNHVYCGPASVAWIAAVWNAHAGVTYHAAERLNNKQLFGDGPRAFSHRVPWFQEDLDQTLRRETNGALGLSSQRHFHYRTIHSLLRSHEMPFVVRIPMASMRHGLHYVTLFKSVLTDVALRCYWQDNGVFRSDEKVQEGISVSNRLLKPAPLFWWGARQVVRLH